MVDIRKVDSKGQNISNLIHNICFSNPKHRKEEAMNIFEELKNLPDASSIFRAWLWKMEGEGLLGKLLEKISLVSPNNSHESLLFLSQLSREIETKEKTAIACCDVEGENRIFRKVRTLLREGNGNSGGNSLMLLGTISHGVMPLIVSDELFRRGRRKKVSANGQQLEIFNNTKDLQMQMKLFAEEELSPAPFGILDAETPISMKFSRVRKLWERVSEKAEKSGWQWPDWYFVNGRELEELFLLFSPMFQKHSNFFRKLWHRGGDTFAVAVMLMSLASATIHFRKEKDESAFFPEVPILDFTKHGLGGGRADGIRISPVFGGFSKKEKRMVEDLKKYHKKYSFKSFGHLFSALSRLKSPLKFDIVDWKFFIGDILARGESRTMNLSALNLPLAEHVEQVKRYLSFSSLSLHFHDPERYALDWSGGAEKSVLCYLSPFSSPMIFEIGMSAGEKKSSFLQRIVEDWDVLQETAGLRNFNNAFCRQLLPLLENSTNRESENGTAETKGKNKTTNLPLFGEAEGEKPVRKVVKELKNITRRSFIDEFELVRRVRRRDGTEMLLMDFSALLDAIAADKILTRGITARGGFIACVMPDHIGERTPSFHISPSKRTFKCFGCGASGKLVNIPNEIAAQIPATVFISGKGFSLRAEMKKTAIPEKHHLVMLTAQKILQSKFWGSEAERYLKAERLIDPDLAFSLGAGFGEDGLINGLMDWGLSLDELHFYGFVGFSQSLNQSRGIGPILARRGLKLEQMRREIKIIKAIGAERKVVFVEGYPFSSLDCRVTFPLALAGKNTNFYGRAVRPCDKRYSHRKLKTDNVPQGGFNIEALNGESDEIFVVESAIDGLSLMMLLGTQSVISVIGVDNYIVLDLVAESVKKITIALNNDLPDSKDGMGSGQKATQKIIERFKKQGLGVRDLTPEMLVPAGLNDYNNLWRRMVREKQKRNF
ncbi:hypothetical protein A3J77_00240 [Candidatus Wolfebacteria bacterium RBG_13_41_7]|uniref:Toprim domain-containing protein n=1 Tax=Candidatus Wolfebacteria bacterium RBG_13_41_7 TaxID=1802554 RepID=A0A1F8DPA2_9BACT|nr:MAG: hypothetical protein A3J77_00240 [Candidatus Wolfebacteria bacterium RBG_13_41_7]